MHDDGSKDGLDALVRQLPRDVSPPADLWLEIEPRLADERSSSALESLARRLPAEIEPPAHVWQGIAARLAARRARAAGVRLAAVAAAASLAVIAALAAMLVRAPAAGPQIVDTGTEQPREASRAPWIFAMPAVDPAIAAEFLRSYELVRNERLAIENAIEAAPDNLLLRELWANAYVAELELSDTLERTIMTYQRGRGI
jgi:hypothetical protein